MYLRQAGLTRNPTFSYLYPVRCRGQDAVSKAPLERKYSRCAPGAGRVSVDGTRQTTQRLTSQTVKQNQNNIRTTIISRGETVVTSQLYCTATYHS